MVLNPTQNWFSPTDATANLTSSAGSKGDRRVMSTNPISISKGGNMIHKQSLNNEFLKYSIESTPITLLYSNYSNNINKITKFN